MTDSELPRYARIGRVALRVNDLMRTADFYDRVVGLRRLESGPDRVVLGTGGVPLVVLEHAPEAPERGPDQAGLFHTAVCVPSRAALGDALARIDTEWRLSGASDHRVSEALYLRDPEGNGVEIYRDRPSDEWPEDTDGLVQMDTLPLDLSDLRQESEDRSNVPDGTTIGHVHLEVTDLAAARACYVDALGFRVRQAFGDDALFLAAGNYHHHVGLNTWHERSEPSGGRGIAWFEVLVPDRAAIEDALSRAEAAGLTVTRGDVPEVRDPDGIRVRLRRPQTLD